MLKALRRMYFFRPPGSHLPMDPPSNNPPNTMDQIPVDGHGIYNCMLHLLSLQILSTLTPTAMELGVPEATAAVQTEMDTELAAAKAEFETIFWNPATGRYRFCDGTGGITGRVGQIFRNPKIVPPPDAVFVDAFYAQAVASQLGLPDLIDLERARTHWNNTIDAFLAPTDPDGNSDRSAHHARREPEPLPHVPLPRSRCPAGDQRGDSRLRLDGGGGRRAHRPRRPATGRSSPRPCRWAKPWPT